VDVHRHYLGRCKGHNLKRRLFSDPQPQMGESWEQAVWERGRMCRGFGASRGRFLDRADKQALLVRE
jgi:hypothetical protein